MINFQSEIERYFNIPSIPKKVWDGKKSFKDGIAIVTHYDDTQSYVAVTFDADVDLSPRVKKVFSLNPFSKIEMDSIFIVPDYMNVENIEGMDLDEVSKQNAQRLVDEAKELENEGGEAKVEKIDEGASGYYFDSIHNDEEARAFIRYYNKKHKIKANVPTNHDEIMMRLAVIYKSNNK